MPHHSASHSYSPSSPRCRPTWPLSSLLWVQSRSHLDPLAYQVNVCDSHHQPRFGQIQFSFFPFLFIQLIHNQSSKFTNEEPITMHIHFVSDLWHLQIYSKTFALPVLQLLVRSNNSFSTKIDTSKIRSQRKPNTTLTKKMVLQLECLHK